ncbi:hypothetical protein OG311_23955 [Streptomyces sp. NBC_01343]|uniref:hypothetical protein n=1 Tax=Streptomyces sp. NBC_01343 TaxID=2903832 RepID=UPI002E0EFB17|nr:hypothetical protein OG311_23955 [Streptomyces sp. NBC_01343]
MRNKSLRIAVLIPLAASPLVLGPTVLAHPAAAAPAAGTCNVTNGYAPPPNTWAINGSGFTGDTVAVKGDNGYSNPAAKVTNGSVREGGVPQGHYTVGGVTCTGGKDPVDAGTGTGTDTGADAKAQYDKGFQKGFQTIRGSCSAKPPQTLGEVDPNWQKGYDNGAALAAKSFCGDKTDGQTGTSEYDKGHKLGYDTTKATCQTAPPKTAVAPDPEWIRGYNEGAAKASAEFCK